MSLQIFNAESARIKCSTSDRCQFDGKIILIGDSLRSVYHFHAQGINAGLEDSKILYELLKREKTPNAITEFEKLRIPVSKALVQLSRRNFFFLKDIAKTTTFQAKFILDRFLTKLSMDTWPSSYQLVCSGDVDFNRAEGFPSTPFIWTVGSHRYRFYV